MRYILFATLFLTSFANVLRAQDLKKEMKLKLRESLLMPENQAQSLHQQQQIDMQQNNDILKVSPTTKLPTKYDRLLIIPKQEMEIHLDLKVTNSTPINMRPQGSTDYVFIGRKMVIVSTAGQLVVPSGKSFDPPRGRSEKRRLKVKKIIETY